jgi:hypothetical protein
MSLFSFLKNDKPVYSDKVWKEGEFAIKGMMTDALQTITKNEIPVVLTFFTDTRHQIMDFLTTRQVPYVGIDSTNEQDALNQTQVVFLLDATLLNSSTQLISLLTSLSKKQKLNFFFYGHYPIPTKENKILEKLVFPGCEITFYSSLDDPAFMIFGGDQLKATLEKLGLAKEEAIEHAMVTRAMKNAREKIEQSVKQEIPCSTEVEWFSRNYKNAKDLK